MSGEYEVIDALKTFTIARYQEKVNNTSVSAKDQQAARDSIRWVRTVVYDAKGGPYTLGLGVEILAGYARRWRSHPDYDPLWDTIKAQR